MENPGVVCLYIVISSSALLSMVKGMTSSVKSKSTIGADLSFLVQTCLLVRMVRRLVLGVATIWVCGQDRCPCGQRELRVSQAK